MMSPSSHSADSGSMSSKLAAGCSLGSRFWLPCQMEANNSLETQQGLILHLTLSESVHNFVLVREEWVTTCHFIRSIFQCPHNIHVATFCIQIWKCAYIEYCKKPAPSLDTVPIHHSWPKICIYYIHVLINILYYVTFKLFIIHTRNCRSFRQRHPHSPLSQLADVCSQFPNLYIWRLVCCGCHY